MSLSNPNLPKSVLALRTYTAQAFLHDLLAGITVGLVALPLAMAFGIASGVTPQAGLYTAVVAGFLISALGGSRTQIGGPTGAFVVIVAGIVARFGMSGLALVTLMAGILLVGMGLTGLGAAVRFIPRMVVIGFTNGIAILIASTQIKDFFGLRTGAVPSEFLPRMRLLATHLSNLNATALALGLASLAILLVLPRFTRRVPASIVAVFVCTVAVAVFHLPVETIGSKFGGIPGGLPPFAIPDFHSEHILPLIPSAFTVAMLAALESMLSAVVADGMTGDRHNPNVELVAQGIANICSPVFGGIPATGAIARTATNIRAGARSPVSGMVHALTLLAILLVAAPLASYIPLATLAAVLFVVAYNMGEWHEIGAILQLDFAAISVWLITFGLTVFADLTVAVAVGLDPGRAALHLSRRRYHHGFARQRRLHSRRPAPRAAGPHHPALRHAAAHPRAVSLRNHREAGRGDGQHRSLRAGGHSAPAQHDGHRRHRHSRHRDLCQTPARLGPHPASVRRDGAAVEASAAAALSRSSSAGKTSCPISRPRSTAPRQVHTPALAS